MSGRVVQRVPGGVTRSVRGILLDVDREGDPIAVRFIDAESKAGTANLVLVEAGRSVVLLLVFGLSACDALEHAALGYAAGEASRRLAQTAQRAADVSGRPAQSESQTARRTGRPFPSPVIKEFKQIRSLTPAQGSADGSIQVFLNRCSSCLDMTEVSHYYVGK
ncbi:hypothetical protein JJE66_34645 [Bradyrhizobium diazoefficiens]|uniref:hypothetical protein n=1 Tax=Bradyrhizobium diazoefficiens TaxID=1355477 RepID=UPI00190BD8F3|nr:hypothetical protein [Bradyrhizobium diazoefficiens]MBK3666340.1 hypothetical protein [Bradyrhizobium diazoefficiens]